jgi:osmotically-inducible protein OsmY
MSKITSVLAFAALTSVIFTSACTMSAHHENSPVAYTHSSAITFKVKENLFRDPTIKSAHISVSTYRDTVTLSGYVFNEHQEDRAIDIARNVKGVKYVVDNLYIKHTH